MHAIKHGDIRGMYVQGENPAMSDPDANHARAALAALDHLVVQDIFLTETAYLADVILPAGRSPRRPAPSPTPTAWCRWAARPIDAARRCAPGPVDHPGDRQAPRPAVELRPRQSEVFDEMRHTMPSIGGITWDRLEREHAVTYPCTHEGDPGQSVVFTDDFPREGGRGPASCRPTSSPPPSGPTPQYPMVLITGRQLEHWHTGSMTRRASVLDAIEPDPDGAGAPAGPGRHGRCKPGDVLTVESRRGKVTLYARAEEGTPRGSVFVAFAFYEAAINQA